MPRRSLPSFVEPMLAQSGGPIDSDDYQFEIKWDGIRAISVVADDRWSMLSRRRNPLSHQFPEFEFLSALPAGTVLDGEIVLLNQEGMPDFAALMSRENRRDPVTRTSRGQVQAATYIVFDQLYANFESLLNQPIEYRLEQLNATVGKCSNQRLVQSEVIIGGGIEFYEQTVARGLEGIVAKRRGSRYLPGKRTKSWIKIKRRSEIFCAIVGYIPKGEDDMESILVATDIDGELTYVGKVGTGFSDQRRTALVRQLRTLHVDQPLIKCRGRGQWVQPALFCKVRYLEKTKRGELRDAVFVGLVE